MFSFLLAEEDCSMKRGQPSITRDLPKSSSSFSSSSSFISPHEIMNGSLNGWLYIRYQGQNYGYLANFVLLFILSVMLSAESKFTHIQEVLHQRLLAP